MYLPLFIGSGWGPWNQWSQCSSSCGIGTRTRVRRCQGAGSTCTTGEPFQVEACTGTMCGKYKIMNCNITVVYPLKTFYFPKSHLSLESNFNSDSKSDHF